MPARPGKSVVELGWVEREKSDNNWGWRNEVGWGGAVRDGSGGSGMHPSSISSVVKLPAPFLSSF